MTDVYKVGVSLVMTGNFAQVLGVLSQKLLGINAQVKELEKGFNRVGIAVTGALAAFTGTRVLETMSTMLKYGDQLVHQQNLLAAAGAKQQEIAEATAQAYRISAQVQTSNTAEVMRHIRELRYAFGRMPSENITREVELANAGMQAVGGHDYSDQVWDLVKSEEMTNRMSEPEFIKAMHLMQQVYNASGGKVTPQQFFQAFKYGRTAAASWNDEFIGGALGRAIQNLGGGSGGGGGRAGPGNALMSAYAELNDANVKTAAKRFGGLGIYHNQRVSGADLFNENPYEWVQQILMPSLAAQGITDPNKIRERISQVFPNRTAGQIISEFATQGRYAMGEENSLYEKDIRLQHEGMFGEAFYKMLMNKDYQTNLKAFTEQWNSLMQALGAAMVPTAIKYMQMFTNAFTTMTQFAKDNPERVKQIAEVIGALAAAFVVIGGAAVIAAITPLVGAGGLIAGLAAALIALGKVDFLGITSKLDALEKSIQGFGQSLRDWFKNANPGIMGNGSPTSYTGGASYQPISYTTGGGGGGGGGGYSSTGGGTDYSSGVASNPGSSVGRSVSRSVGASINAGSMPMGPGVATTNSYIAAQRSGFAAELSDPNKRLAFAAMMDMEGLPVPDAESAMNRSSMVGKTLMQMLHSGFYGPINKGMLPGRMRELLRNPKRLAALNHAIDTALAGSDIIHGATDQGNLKLGDPNARWPGGRTFIGSEVFNDWGGGGGHEHSRQWREHFESQALKSRPPNNETVHGNPAYSNWQWHHNFSTEHSPVGPTSGNEVHVHHATYLDGRQIAKNSMKHMAKMGSGRVSGARLTDFSGTRPAEV